MPFMTDTTGSNTAATEGWDGHNVIAVSFEDDRNAYKALTSLKELDSQQRVGVREAVVVERGEDGQIVEKDRVESTSLPATASGGLIGLLLGVIGGPLGVLVGGTYGLFVGSLFGREVGDVRQHDPHAVAGLHALGPQQAGDAGGGRVELGVGQAAVVDLDRHTLCVRGRAPAEEMHEVGHDPQRMGVLRPHEGPNAQVRPSIL
jgi:hypothetical protein